MIIADVDELPEQVEGTAADRTGKRAHAFGPPKVNWWVNDKLPTICGNLNRFTRVVAQINVDSVLVGSHTDPQFCFAPFKAALASSNAITSWSAWVLGGLP